MELNWSILFVSAIIPLLISSFWYSKRFFGNMWTSSARLTDEMLLTRNNYVLLIALYLIGLFISVILSSMVIHQFGVLGVLNGQPGLGEEGSSVQLFWRIFYIALAIAIEISAMEHSMEFSQRYFCSSAVSFLGLFEGRGWKFIAVHFGYWLVCLTLMGGLICHFI